ncbi:hypothetical protein D3C85_174680 [compost metagenome]
MATIKAVVECREALNFLPDTKIFLITDVKDNLPQSHIGYFTYGTKAGFTTQKQRFYMEVGGDSHSSCQHKEIDFIASFGAYLERKFKECGVQVFEVNLPKSHGYSGNTYGYFTTLRLFPHAGIKKQAA